jgi:hypothetical protein
MTNGYIKLTVAMAKQQALVRNQRKKDRKLLFLLYQGLDKATFEKVA